MNIDGCRVRLAEGEVVHVPQSDPTNREGEVGRDLGFTKNDAEAFRQAQRESIERTNTLGRWPANVLLSCPPDCDDDTHAPGCPCAALDAQHDGASRYFNRLPIEADDFVPFFYAAKASRKEREEGCDDVPPRPVPSLEVKVGRESPRAGAGRTAMTLRNHHPTVKPAAVMAWCVRLVSPPGGVVLDPFMGSGSTGIGAVREGVNFIGIEREADYMEIARARIEHAKRSKA
jgi:site-specific DNA-methyltransferase (adenine-specific)